MEPQKISESGSSGVGGPAGKAGAGPKEKPKFRKKIRAIHDYIQVSHYLSDNNLQLGGEDWNDTILLSILTALAPGKELIVGDVGNGKTTVAEAVTSIIYGYTPAVVEACELHGQPFLTEEKTFGRPDLGELQKGKEKVVWSNFSKFKGAKVVDEINRIPEGTQNALLNSVDRGTFTYLNEVLFQPDMPFDATANYPDAGNTPLIRPLSDRFNVSVEVTSPIGREIFLEAAEENQKLLKNDELTKAMLECVEANDSGKLDELRTEFRKRISEKGIPTFSDEEIENYRELLKNSSMEPEGSMMVSVFFSEANSFSKIPGEHAAGVEHYGRSVTGSLENNISVRWRKSISKYAKAAAVALDMDAVTPEIVAELMPCTLAHRVKFTGKFAQENLKDEFYAGSHQKWLSRQLAKDFIHDFNEKKEVYKELCKSLVADDGNSLRELAEKYDLPSIRSIAYRRNVWQGGASGGGATA